ncbi:MAG TPA: TolC family outer membrane protein [Limnobacter sp.]|uniref:TolC family outer membrane protein n=1 Tax=Limnobacter sp. TaxID=2003368 RepID=UPI002ED9D0AD
MRRLLDCGLNLAARRFGLAFVAAACMACASPALAQVRDLASLVRLAKLRDPVYLAAQAQTQADLELENQARGALLPNLNASAQLQKVDTTSSLRGFSVSSSDNPKTYALNLSQALFRPQAWESYKQSQLSGEIAKLALNKAEQDLILRVSKAYFDVLAAQDDLNNLQAQKAATTEQLAFAKRNFEVGTATITDQQEAQARYDLIVAQELAARNQLDVRTLALENIVGEPVQLLARLSPDVTLQGVEPMNADIWADRAQASNLDVQQARLAQIIAKREVKKARDGHLPTVDLNAQVVNTSQQIFDAASGRPFSIDVDNKTLTLAVTVPIFSGGATQSKVRQQASLLDKSLNQVEQANRGATQGAKAAFLAVNTGLAQVAALETAVKSSELALKANKTGYEVGVRINIDVLNAQQQLNATQRDLAKARYNALVSMLELQAAVGALNVQSVDRINALLVNNGL